MRFVAASLLLLCAAAASAQDTTRVRRDTLKTAPAPAPQPAPRRDTVTVIPANPRADTIPVPGDTGVTRSIVPVPPVPRNANDSLARDTLRAPLAHASFPIATSVGPAYRWSREELFASGAITLDDLLERVPGATAFTSGWLLAPHTAAYQGDASRVRVFYDGIELDRIDPMFHEALDLGTIPLWSIEDVMIERGATELRVHLRSWRAEHSTPVTRTDVYTGDRQTELFRGFLAKRGRGGSAFQVAGQTLSANDRLGGGGDQQTYLGRLGYAAQGWSIDAFATRDTRRRGATLEFPTGSARLARRDLRTTLGYVRAAIGDVERGPWFQAIGSLQDIAELSANSSTSTTVDTMTHPRAFAAQYLVTGGVTRGPIMVSGSDRLRRINGSAYSTLSVRGSFTSSFIAVSGYAERDAWRRGTVWDAGARWTPLSFVSVSAATGRYTVNGDAADSLAPRGSLPGPSFRASRLEAGMRLRGSLWFGGGVLQRDSIVARPLRIFDTTYVARADSSASAIVATLRGRLWRDMYADVRGTRWSRAGIYRPRDETRSEIGLNTRWLARFPSRTFQFKAALIHEYRSGGLFPDSSSSGVNFVDANEARSMSFLVEIRILSGVITWQNRNSFGSYNTLVPGYLLPRNQNFYGVRWDFYN